MDYILRLVDVQEKVKDKILIIPRIYTNKPRTTGKGYKGLVHQPDPVGEEPLPAHRMAQHDAEHFAHGRPVVGLVA